MEYLPDRRRVRGMTTEELRDGFLVRDLFEHGRATFRFFDLDRVVLAGVVPSSDEIVLEAPPELDSDEFTDRREVGLLNVGESGTVSVDGDTYELGRLDCLYVGRHTGSIRMRSRSAQQSARFYLVSYPAHAHFPTTLVRHADVEPVVLGSPEKANQRALYKYIHPDGVQSAQLVMGITQIRSGSVWNTMPAHTHARRSEVYMYFDVKEDDVVFHFMGEPSETRSLVMRNEEAVLSPAWSIHAGAGTAAYSFCWAMGGENQDFGDMQGVSMPSLR